MALLAETEVSFKLKNKTCSGSRGNLLPVPRTTTSYYTCWSYDVATVHCTRRTEYGSSPNKKKQRRRRSNTTILRRTGTTGILYRYDVPVMHTLFYCAVGWLVGWWVVCGRFFSECIE